MACSTAYNHYEPYLTMGNHRFNQSKMRKPTICYWTGYAPVFGESLSAVSGAMISKNQGWWCLVWIMVMNVMLFYNGQAWWSMLVIIMIIIMINYLWLWFWLWLLISSILDEYHESVLWSLNCSLMDDYNHLPCLVMVNQDDSDNGYAGECAHHDGRLQFIIQSGGPQTWDSMIYNPPVSKVILRLYMLTAGYKSLLVTLFNDYLDCYNPHGYKSTYSRWGGFPIDDDWRFARGYHHGPTGTRRLTVKRDVRWTKIWRDRAADVNLWIAEAILGACDMLW